MENKIAEYLKEKNPKLCVLATVNSEGKPECSVVGYGIKDDLTILISTTPKTRKWQNLKTNQSTALTIGWTFTENNIQIEGKATLIESNHPEYNQVDEFFFNQNPNAKAFRTPETVFILIKPTWARVLDLSTHPPKEEEKQIG